MHIHFLKHEESGTALFVGLPLVAIALCFSASSVVFTFCILHLDTSAWPGQAVQTFCLRTIFYHAGTVPSTWAQAGAFPTLRQLYFANLPLQGSLPPTWGTQGCFASLEKLAIQDTDGMIGVTKIAGELPAEWASPAAFQRLQILEISGLDITG